MNINISIKMLIITIVLFLGICIGFYFYIDNLKSRIIEQENTISLLNQNDAGLRDQLTMKADSIQNFSILVSDLQNSNSDLVKETKELINDANKSKYLYKLLYSKYNLLLDSIIVLNDTAHVDTSNNIIRVDFEGKKGKIHYKGYTNYFTLTGIGKYSINISVDPIAVKSLIYYDTNTNLIQNKLYADGVYIDDAITEVDSLIYLKMRSSVEYITTDTKGFFDNLSLVGNIEQPLILENDKYKFGKLNFNFGLEYNTDSYRVYGMKNLLSSDIKFGFEYKISINGLFSKIF